MYSKVFITIKIKLEQQNFIFLNFEIYRVITIMLLYICLVNNMNTMKI